MAYQRILTIQDISCVGQCSLTVALPILSACGLETCILPSAVLSTHTAGFTGYTVHDLTEEFPAIAAHWKKENVNFKAIYTGYLGSCKQIEYVSEIFRDLVAEGGKIIVDPAMADNGKLYPAFNDDYVQGMISLCRQADVLLPNITEACFLTGTPYMETYTEEDVKSLLQKLADLGCPNVVITGIGYKDGETGIAMLENGVYSHYAHKRIPVSYHGTGDVYSSAFTGAWVNGKSLREAVILAADYTVACIEETQADEGHWYGVKFEAALPKLIKEL